MRQQQQETSAAEGALLMPTESAIIMPIAFITTTAIASGEECPTGECARYGHLIRACPKEQLSLAVSWGHCPWLRNRPEHG